MRVRLGVIVAASLVVALAAATVLADVLFERQQLIDLETLLERELTRVQGLLAVGGIGEELLGSGSGDVTLQLVTVAGVVVVPGPTEPAIPLAVEPRVGSHGGVESLLASTPWLLGSDTVLGTVRLAYDLSGAAHARANLRSALLIAGLLIAALAVTVTLSLVGRELRPLTSLARRADALDPVDPHLERETTREDEVGRVEAALHGAVAAIRQRKAEEREALAAVAHELAAPLTVVAGRLEALAHADDDPRLHAAHDAAKELLHTSRDLLALARGELGLTLDMEVVDLAAVAARVVGEYPGVTVGAQGVAEVLGSEIRLAQAVRNLIRNAVQASGGNDGVEVSVVGREDVVTLTVTDDGPGLDPEAARRAFEANYTTRPDGRGHGLGLVVVRTIVEAHGATVELASAPGGGAEATITMPSLETSLGA